MGKWGEPMDIGGGESPSGGIRHKWGGALEDTMFYSEIIDALQIS